MISFFILLYNKDGDTTMNRHIKQDTSWWQKDPFMKMHAHENAYLFLDTTFKEECKEDYLKLMRYGYSHFRYLDLLHGGYEYVKIEDVEKFEKNNNVLHLHKRILPIDVRRIEMQFEEICFYWMQPAEVAVNYIKEHYEKEHQEETLLEKIDEPANKSVSLKQYKLSRGEKLC